MSGETRDLAPGTQAVRRGTMAVDEEPSVSRPDRSGIVENESILEALEQSSHLWHGLLFARQAPVLSSPAGGG